MARAGETFGISNPTWRCGLLLVASATLLAAGCGVPGADGPADTYGLDFSLPADATRSGAMVFMVDGLNAAIFEQMLQAGELPAIKTYFVDRGMYWPRAVANIPSVTMANQTSLVTGLFPGHHGVTGINWFDRNRLIWRNYETIAQKNTLDGDYTAATIFEAFGGRTTYSIFHQAHRGATNFIENWTSAGPPFFFGWYEFVDRLTLYRLNIVADIARKRGEFPAVTWVYLLAPDFRAYESGVNNERYRQAIRHTDRQIGRVLADLERDGLLGGLVIALVSDHSLGDVTKHFELARHLRGELGLDVATGRLTEQTPFEQRVTYYRKHSAVLYGSGDRYAAICLRKPLYMEGRSPSLAAWPVRPDIEDLMAYPTANGKADLLSALSALPAVDAVAYLAGPDRVRVRTKAGAAQFDQPAGRGGLISYRTTAGSDPVGWAGSVSDELLSGLPATPRQWLDATHGTEFPDLPAQILAYFRARRAGDIVLFAAPGYDFNTINRAGHGGLRPGWEMHVPMLLAGPGVPKGRGEVARTVDLVPTLLGLSGRPVPPGLDGANLLAEPNE